MRTTLIFLAAAMAFPTAAGGQGSARLQYPHTTVREVRITGAADVDSRALKAIVDRFQGRVFDDPEWMNELVGRIVDAEQRHGYFEADADPTVKRVSGDSNRRTVDVEVTVEEGRQYRLASLRWLHATAFTTDELSAMVPLHSGEVFDTEKVRQGLEQLRKAYGQRGYVNIVDIPETTIDREGGTITLLVDFDEGGSFHVGKVDITGVSDQQRQQYLAILKPGDLFTTDRWEQFAGVVRTMFPQDRWDPLLSTRLDLQTNDTAHTVAIAVRPLTWGKVEIDGANRTQLEQLLAILKPGDLYDEATYNRFKQALAPMLPAAAYPDDVITLVPDFPQHVVDMLVHVTAPARRR